VASYKLTQKADEDLVDIFNYGIDHFGVDNALAFYHELSSMFDRIANSPNQFQAVGEIRQFYRRAVFKTYSIYFIEKHDFVEISRVVRKDDLRLIFS
jgi:toxin ParE1/3/4